MAGVRGLYYNTAGAKFEFRRFCHSRHLEAIDNQPESSAGVAIPDTWNQLIINQRARLVFLLSC